MKTKNKDKETQHITLLHDYLALVPQQPNKRMYTFFNLLYVQNPPHYILLENPLQVLKEEIKDCDIYEAASLLLACNENNLNIFIVIPSFLRLCNTCCKKFDSIPTKYHLDYIKYLQVSILYHLDSKAIRQIIKHIRVLREHGIISFHEQKCIGVLAQVDVIESHEATNTNSITMNSFIHLSPDKTPLYNQFKAIAKAKKFLKRISWARNLIFLCEEDFTKKVVVIGGQKTGKSTLIATMLYDDKKSIESNMPLEAKAPIEYYYGKGSANAVYMHPNDLQTLQESPLANVAQHYKTLQENFYDCLKNGNEKVQYEKIYDLYLKNNKIDTVDRILVPQDYNLLQFIHFINTPSLIPHTFRHLQVYGHAARSDIVLYLASFDELNITSSYDKIIAVLLRLLKKANISHIHFIVTHIDKANMTLRKKQNLCQKLQSTIEERLVCTQKEKQNQLAKLNFHFIATEVAYSMRCRGVSVSESGFDITTSGILELESAVFTHTFNTPSTHFNIQMLEHILTLCKLSNETMQANLIIENNKEEIKTQVKHIKSLCQEVTKRLPTQYYSFYDAFANLRDNLYSQFIQALNYETKKRGNIDIQKLKTSMIQSLIVGLKELARILQEHFFTFKELHEITTLLQPNNTDSIAKFAITKEHKKILDLIFTQYTNSIKTDFFDDSNALVVEHLSYRLDILLPNTIKKTEIQEDSVIKPLKESFDYYFLLLEQNINTLFHNKISLFNIQIDRLECILESCFIKYFEDPKGYETEELDTLITMLTHGGGK
ncbi:MAG: hypothetical protein MR025_03750 [Helicobacter trogontum]|uniref:hypothetical protein n=1 Tax=Helicobacter trogontum TaxID=50960 RepID=UPI000CF046A8|nr:hypothetical protein [Helicobacter trogontum]MCI5786550.1 hypothetical protein [Helicobacter trogontum]